jgi:hypothetical protein
MDDFQIELAEKIFGKAKETGRLPDKMFAQFILTHDQQNDPKRIKDVTMVIEILIDQGLLKSDYQRSSNIITPSPFSINFKTYQEFLIFQDQEAEKIRKKEEREEKKYDLEIENLKLQIIHQRQWFWKAFAAAIIVELVQFYFIFIKE